LEAQSANTIALFRTEVIPTIANENQKNRQMVLNHLTSANKETRKSLEAFSAKNQKLNQKLIEILQESLKLGVGTKSLLDSIKKDLEINHASLEGTNNKLKIADEKFNKLAESLKSLQAQNTTTSETLGALKADLEHSGEFNKLADEKFNKLIELTSELAVHSTELEESVVGQLKESALKEDASNIKVDLANEKLSRLIEILKTIAKEQTKLDPLATTLGAMQKEQVALQKTQAVLMKNQKEIKEALADLRRKANVNISRNDEIKKTLRQLSSAKSGAGRK
jgi:chromosome segregation ATPase